MGAGVVTAGRPVCPVCWAVTQPTARGNIASHFDAGSQVCPGSGHPYSIVVQRPRPWADSA